MKLSQFKFRLPEELIAQHPVEERDNCRLMVVNRKTGEITHHIFKDILNIFEDGDTFIFNNTKVFPALLYGNTEKTGAKIEVTLLRELNAENKFWDVLVEPARKIRIGNKLYFGEDESMVAEVIDNTTSRGRTLRFLYDAPHDEFKQTLYSLGMPWIPEYIGRAPEEADFADYQTIYADSEGAVVAPAAGLHFSRELMKRMEIKGINEGYITCHTSIGNFREIDVEDLTKHRVDSEQLIIPENVVEMVNQTKDRGNKVVAVGVSVLRGFETAVSMGGHIKEYDGWTNKFIFPPYDFTVADAFITNFHLPYSTMLMLTCAYGGYDIVMKAYNTAIQEGYRFGIYGDAMLII